MGKNNNNKNGKASAVGKLVAGAKKHFPNGKQQLLLGGASMTVDDAVAELQEFIDSRSAVVAAQATAKTKVEAERARLPALYAFISAFEQYVRLAFGKQVDVLADFGISPRKAKTPMTAEQKAVAAAKRDATRAARGTKGPKAKKQVKGNVTAKLVVTPVTGESAPAPTAPSLTAPVAPVAPTPVVTSAPEAAPPPVAEPATHAPSGGPAHS